MKKTEDGLASLVIVTVIVTILALITIGFAKLMDYELRQSLDRQLSLQAQYAAESGLNDARRYIVQNANSLTDAKSCKDLDLTQQPFVSSLSGDGNVEYSCILINTTPSNLIYTINAGQSVVFKVVPKNGATINSMFFSWENNYYPPDPNNQNKPNPGPLGNYPDFPKENNVSQSTTGLLRATIYPVPNSGLGGSSDSVNAALESGARNYFFYPNSTGNDQLDVGLVGQVPYGSNGTVVRGQCNEGNRASDSNPPGYLPYPNVHGVYCNSVVTGMPGNVFYYIKLTAIYNNLTVSIQGNGNGTLPPQNIGSGCQKVNRCSNLDWSPIPLGGAEAVVDANGVGSDVSKREEAFIPLRSNFSYPSFTVQSIDTLCKRFKIPVGTGSKTNYLPAIIEDQANNSDGACQPQ
jgi:hypothetical protein